ncbi:tetratricopeptide repeat protein [Anaerovibrio sp. RM50]|uniref:tetratricopeptide repeat protein n=1 Tax=Anaerovibrio sp. RM50 TaxID=1200557 RepID=UPI000483E21C|nr:tetratricopeptide repeat protein [Anaerovibrio sp. RM50]
MKQQDRYICFLCGERRRSSNGEPPAGKCPQGGEYKSHIWLDDKRIPRRYREYIRNKEAGPLTPERMCALGSYYKNSPDMKKSSEWFLKAGNLGSVEGMLAMGSAYLDGSGVTKDIGEAIKWYQNAANKGNRHAKQVMLELHEKYNTGATLEYVKKEANKGKLKAVLLLARSYEEGKVVAQDKTKAMELYRQVAEKVTIGPSFMIGGAMIGGALWDGIIMDVLAQTNENNVYDMTRRGYAYEHGTHGVEQDKNEALKWYQKAAEAGGTYAMFVLGNEYASGEHQDKEKALMWYRKAAEKGLASAKKKPSPWESS